MLCLVQWGHHSSDGFDGFEEIGYRCDKTASLSRRILEIYKTFLHDRHGSTKAPNSIAQIVPAAEAHPVGVTGKKP